MKRASRTKKVVAAFGIVSATLFATIAVSTVSSPASPTTSAVGVMTDQLNALGRPTPKNGRYYQAGECRVNSRGATPENANSITTITSPQTHEVTQTFYYEKFVDCSEQVWCGDFRCNGSFSGDSCGRRLSCGGPWSSYFNF